MSSGTGNARIVYDDFSGGDYGNAGGAKAPKGSFKALNMLVTADGYLCPRPGWKDRTPNAGLAAGSIMAITPTPVGARDMMVIIDATVYAFDLDDPTVAPSAMGILDTTPTTALYPKIGTTEFYITVPGDKVYKLDPVSGTIDPFGGTPGGRELEIYGERMIVADNSLPRIYFSDAADYTNFPPANFIDVGDNWTITGLREQKNHLTIFKSRGKYILTGVPGVNPVLRKVERSHGVLHPGQLVPDEEDRLWFVPAFHQNPASFDGASTAHVDYLKSLGPGRDGDNPDPAVVIGAAETIGDRSPSTVVITQKDTGTMLLNHNGIWTRHTVTEDITGRVRGGFTGDFYVDTASNQILSNYFALNRPATSADGLVQPGDDSTTPVYAEVTFPQFWSPDATEFQVTQVIVDFEKYNLGDVAEANHFVIGLTMLGRSPAGTLDAGEVTYTWNEVGTEAGDSVGDSVRDRVVAGLATADATGYELRLTSIRGVRIKSVTVVTSLSKNLPVD